MVEPHTAMSGLDHRERLSVSEISDNILHRQLSSVYGVLQMNNTVC